MTKLLQPAYNDKDDNNYDTKAIATPHVSLKTGMLKKHVAKLAGVVRTG